MQFTLYVDVLINPGEPPREGVRIGVLDGVISFVEDQVVPSRGDIALTRSTCSPSLFNAHDHLKYTWLTRIGRNGYSNSYEWLPRLYEVAQRDFLQFVSLDDLYWLGVFKSIFSGVTTVANHCRPLPPSFLDKFPIRILHKFRRELFVREYHKAHAMGLGVAEEIRLANDKQLPFVVHIAEGKDAQTAEEIDLLERLEGLTRRAVLVHAINVSPAQISKIATARASVVWCPASNRYLFDETTPILTLIQSGINVALGTDSTCTGELDLKWEMNFALSELQPNVRNPRQLVHAFCTVNGARAFGISDLGIVAPGYRADMLVVDRTTNDPLLDLFSVRSASMVLLMRDGRCLLRRRTLQPSTLWGSTERSHVEIDGVEIEVVGDPLGLLHRVARSTGRLVDEFPLGRMLGLSTQSLSM